jgi:hypothetical protein
VGVSHVDALVRAKRGCPESQVEDLKRDSARLLSKTASLWTVRGGIAWLGVGHLREQTHQLLLNKLGCGVYRDIQPCLA